MPLSVAGLTCLINLFRHECGCDPGQVSSLMQGKEVAAVFDAPTVATRDLNYAVL